MITIKMKKDWHAIYPLFHLDYNRRNVNLDQYNSANWTSIKSFENSDKTFHIVESFMDGSDDHEYDLSYADTLHLYSLKITEGYEIVYAEGWLQLLKDRQEYET